MISRGIKSDVLPAPEGVSYLWNLRSCTEEEEEEEEEVGWVFEGSAVVKDCVVVGREEGR